MARATFPRPGEPQEAAELRALYRNYHREARRQHARALAEGKVVFTSAAMTSTVEYSADEPWKVRITDQVTGGEPTVLERDGSRVRIRQPGREWTFQAWDERIEWAAPGFWGMAASSDADGVSAGIRGAPRALSGVGRGSHGRGPGRGGAAASAARAAGGKLFGRAVGYLGSRDEALLVEARTCAEEAHDRLMAAREELARLSPLGYRDW